LNGKRAKKRKANIQGTLAEVNEPIFSLSFPNPGGKAVAGHALASPGISVSRKKELIVGAKARRIYFYFTSFPPIVKKNRVHCDEKDIPFMPEARVRRRRIRKNSDLN
jgi:hypothetical protein